MSEQKCPLNSQLRELFDGALAKRGQSAAEFAKALGWSEELAEKFAMEPINLPVPLIKVAADSLDIFGQIAVLLTQAQRADVGQRKPC